MRLKAKTQNLRSQIEGFGLSHISYRHYCGFMPLSDHEKRLLDEMERALAADDPRLISTFQGKSPSRSRVVAGFALVMLGILVLFAGLISQLPPLGIAGFAISLIGAVLAVSNLGGLARSAVNAAAGQPKKGGPNKWGARFEQRWDKRNNFGDQ